MATLKVRHVPQYSHLAGLLLAHRGALHAGDDPGAAKDAAALACALEELGPTYIKLGQLLSGRADLLPPAYTEALGRLADHAEPMPLEVVREVIEEELGARLSKVFPSFDEVPLGSASLAQVHRATTRDGRAVAVKVQRPGLRKQIVEDMDVIAELATTFDEHVASAQRAGLGAMVEEFRRSLFAELDYRQEAANLRALSHCLEPYKHLMTPDPVEGLSTSRVLTMTLVEGRNVLSLSPLAGLDTDGERLAGELFKAYLDQVLVQGVFHADPHAGNVMLTTDGRLALVDVGMVSRVSPALQDALLRLLVALSEGQPTEVAQALEKASQKLPGFDHDQLVKEVGPVVAASNASLEDLQIGRQLAELARISVDNGLRPAPELTMLGKALLNLDDVARRLCPTYEPADAIRQHGVHLMRQRMLRSVAPSNLVSNALEAKDLVEHLPQRLNRILEVLAEGRVRLSVEGIDEAEIMRSVQKLANRCAGGLAVAAFVLAAAIFSISSSGPKWFGESAFSIVLLGLAFVLGMGILLATVRNDLPQRRPPGHHH